MKETLKIYEVRQHAMSDDPIKPQSKRKSCIGCKSRKTVLIYLYDYSKIYDYGPSVGWKDKDYIAEFRCKECCKYMVRKIWGWERDYYLPSD